MTFTDNNSKTLGASGKSSKAGLIFFKGDVRWTVPELLKLIMQQPGPSPRLVIQNSITNNQFHQLLLLLPIHRSSLPLIQNLVQMLRKHPG